MDDEIITRRLRFQIEKDLPKYWNDNCPVKTHILNSIAILAPAFERLAITSVIPFKDAPISAHLKAQLSGFIGQESAHGSEFIRFNQVLKGQGYDTKKLQSGNVRNFKWLTQKLSPKMHLSLTLAAEHLTAIISDLLLREPQWLAKATPSIAALWRWHAIEEIEHKAVVYDLYQQIGGGYFKRIFGMWLVTQMLGGILVANFFHLIKKDKLLFKISFWKKLLNVCWGKPGFIRKLLGSYFRYYLPGFHPWQQNNQAMLNDWKKLLTNTVIAEQMVQALQKTSTLAEQ